MIDDKCIWPGCLQFIKPGSDLCFMHDLKSGAPKMKAAPKPISIQSVKRIALQKLYVKIVKEMIAENPYCEVKALGCQKLATGLHHRQKRTEKNLCDTKNLMRACTNCNLFMEEYPEHPISKKYTVSRFK